MKKMVSIAIALLCAAVVFAGGKKDDGKIISVGATPEPHAAMLQLVVDDLAKEGITLEIKEFTDYVTPNEALESGQIMANFFQHLPYLESFNAERGYHLVNAGGIHIEPMALYSKKVAAITDIADGANIAIPNDPTNEGRALKLLEAEGLIKLDPEAGFLATKLDIVENPKNLEIVEMEAAQLPRVLSDVDMAVINGNYAIDAGLKLADAIAIEADDSEAAEAYANVVAVKKGNEDSDKIKALVAALKSDEVKKFMEETYGGAVVPLF